MAYKIIKLPNGKVTVTDTTTGNIVASLHPTLSIVSSYGDLILFQESTKVHFAANYQLFQDSAGVSLGATKNDVITALSETFFFSVAGGKTTLQEIVDSTDGGNVAQKSYNEEFLKFQTEDDPDNSLSIVYDTTRYWTPGNISLIGKQGGLDKTILRNNGELWLYNSLNQGSIIKGVAQYEQYSNNEGYFYIDAPDEYFGTTCAIALANKIDTWINIIEKTRREYYFELQLSHPTVFTTATLGPDILYAYPFYVMSEIEIMSFRIRVTTAGSGGSKMLLGIYKSNFLPSRTGDQYAPDELISSTWLITPSSASDRGAYINVGFKPNNLYWIVIINNSTTGVGLRAALSTEVRTKYPSGFSSAPTGIVNHFETSAGAFPYPVNDTLPATAPIFTNKVSTAANIPILFFK